MDIKSFLQYVSYVVYFLIVSILTYYMQWITVLFVGSIRFTAADSFPGDLSRSSLAIMSFVFSIMHFVVLTIYLLLHNILVSLFKIKFHYKIALVFNTVVAVSLIIYFINMFLY
ncbi:hypothetical protein B1B04_05520 [Lysinibacillus sp. KCTC 33748]|nr:hypothetical protein B1B04_05520 [Lysinibacillus sp. KCTC 33748]SKB45860.1 hypothetical protein SAMN06295926_102589 [Lysinibacillus sp. AC-3]